ncbi:MAG: hypothetical protein J6Y08_02310 [Clostridiales bacterium]|nr:hypothetical protein [Clostridiales bacterium]
MEGIKLTKVSVYHYFRLVVRIVIFLVLLSQYIFHKILEGLDIFHSPTVRDIAIILIFVMFIIEMLLRFFPSSLESPGCQKQFKRNYIKTGKTNIVIEDNNGVVLVALLWVGLNAVLGLLHSYNILGDGIMILIASFYSICDLICILFFCPFQTWILHNKCCATCRIYNWDYAMMFTPLFFIKRWYGWVLLGMAFILALRWELTFYRSPERFSEATNGYLGCANCKEKLCVHKKQLISLRKKLADIKKKKMKNLEL